MTDKKTEDALKIYSIIEDFIKGQGIENTMQVYMKTTSSYEGLRVLADCCDVVGYKK